MIRKLLLLSLTLILSLNSFSQTVTPIRDTTRITLSTETARRIAIDLVEGDKAREEVELLGQEVKELKTIVTLQDSLVFLRENEIKTLNKIIDLKDVQGRENQQRIDQLNRDLRKQVTLKTLFEVSTGVSVIALIISLLVK